MPQFRFWNPYDAQWHYLSERDLGSFPNAVIYEEDENGNQTDLGTVASLGYFNRDAYRNSQGLSYNDRIANLGLQMDENTGIYYFPEPVQLEPSPKVAVNPNVQVQDAPIRLEPSPKVAVNPNAQVQNVVNLQSFSGTRVGIPLSDYIRLKSKSVNYDYLHPEMQRRLTNFAKLVSQDTGGRSIFMTEGYRNFAGQQALAGRSNAAIPGRSLHGFGIASDIRYYGSGGLLELANAAYQRDNSILKTYGVTRAEDLVDAWAAKAGLVRNLHKAGKRNEEQHFQMVTFLVHLNI